MMDLSIAWLVVGVLYVGTAIYLETVSDADIPTRVSFTMLCIGGAIIVAVNRYWWAWQEYALMVLEVLMLMLMLVAWTLAVSLIRSTYCLDSRYA